MKPQQSLLLHRRWVAGESAADEAKHFLHGEGQGAQLDIKHLTVKQKAQLSIRFLLTQQSLLLRSRLLF